MIVHTVEVIISIKKPLELTFSRNNNTLKVYMFYTLNIKKKGVIDKKKTYRRCFTEKYPAISTSTSNLQKVTRCL